MVRARRWGVEGIKSVLDATYLLGMVQIREAGKGKEGSREGTLMLVVELVFG